MATKTKKSAKKPKAKKGITHHHVTRVMYVSMVAFVLCASLVAGIYSQVPDAKAAGFIPYGGTVISVAANVDPVSSIECPFYSVVDNVDADNGLPPIFGIYIPPEFPAPTYDYNNIFTPGVPIMGGIEPIPCQTDTGLQAYPLFFDAPDGPFYLTGTGAF